MKTVNPVFKTLFVLSMVLLLQLAGCNKSPPVIVSLGAPQSASSALVWLTFQLGYFAEQQVQVEMTAYPSGKRALAALLDNKVDLAITAETPFVFASFTQDDLRIFATTGQSDNNVRILARKDHGINQPADLSGKTIATQQASAVHFFLSSFLLLHHSDINAVTIQFFKAEKLASRLASGDVDAISMRDPILADAVAMIGSEKLVEFSEPGLYTKTYNLVGRQTFTSSYPGVMEKILLALSKGAKYVDENPQPAKQMTAESLHIDRQRVEELWPGMRQNISLQQSLLTSIEEEANWFYSSGQVKTQGNPVPVPDFWNRIDPAPLSRVVPGSVGLAGPKTR